MDIFKIEENNEYFIICDDYSNCKLIQKDDFSKIPENFNGIVKRVEISEDNYEFQLNENDCLFNVSNKDMYFTGHWKYNVPCPLSKRPTLEKNRYISPSQDGYVFNFQKNIGKEIYLCIS
ncbi:hypothetical protein ACFPDQ_07120 [Pseudofrancisella aestuarii]|uniref:Uncharacterized protein n=1 Tax=Pseudofrancisella aestuarii TaxID=2670347 RepID=A0ABV9TCB5_9GAMM|nr:hypothetical protein [Pseudofrancisella aestuarii]